MKVFSTQLRFNTPAFLGDAEQNGVWRTPPIKALLRQFWRVAYAAQHNFKVDVTKMRQEEGMLFGYARDEQDMSEPNRKSDYLGAKKSLVRIRLESPDKQAPTSWIQGSQQGVAPLASSLDTSYAWFGIVKRGKGLPDRSGIQPAPAKEGTRLLRLAVPAEYMPQLEETLSLVDYFGLLGSRSRGGWGALHVEGVTPMSETQIGRYARPLDACLQDDWPMSLAADDHGPCVWHSKGTFKSWDTAMRFIAAERKLVRTNLKDLGGKDLRPALGFASTGRMPSPLRWKVVPDGNALKVRIFAMPHRIPDDGGRKMHLSDLQIAWRSVCNALNTNPAFVPRNQ